ncbi:Uncharacterised protein [Serratia quinivorans]|nr:Uncharacterised protein [Serratia quinivorans]CAI1681417.1 Uncharacterised protein [Serratia quinivorans]
MRTVVKFMLVYLLPFCSLFHPFSNAGAVMFPVLTEARITSCSDSRPPGAIRPCSTDVYYSGHVAMLDIGMPVIAPLPGKPLVSLGVHCGLGGNGAPYTYCEWDLWAHHNPGHSPQMTGCKLLGDGTWTIENPSSCSFSSTWGPHIGAGPGGECAVFGQYAPGAPAHTPYGLLDATQVANAGNRFCVKSLPPHVDCTVQLDSTLAHGVQQTNGQHTVSARGHVRCGSSPTVALVGPSELALGDGVTTRLSVSTPSQNEIVVTSDMTIVGGRPGTYSANAVVVVSPQ